MARSCFEVDSRLTLLPVVHASGPYARAVEQWLLEQSMDCLAIPLPPSFGEPVCSAVLKLPAPSIILQPPMDWPSVDEDFEWSNEASDSSEFEAGPEDESTDDDEPLFLDSEEDSFDDSPKPYSYVPIDPSQAVIAAIRFGLGERIPLRFVDLEVGIYQEDAASAPDAFALRNVSLEAFATCVLPAITEPDETQVRHRIQHMATELRKLTQRFEKVIALCSMHHWPWLRRAYMSNEVAFTEPQSVHEATPMSVSENTLLFLMGELPYVTGIYEESRQSAVRPESDIALPTPSSSQPRNKESELDDQTFDPQAAAIDSIKRLLMSARASYMSEFGSRGRRITPLLLSQCLKYIRNLTLLDHRLTPDLYTLAMAAKQILGDQFAIHLVETARHYAFADELDWPTVTLSIAQARLPEDQVVPIVNRLAGSPQQWRTLELNRRPRRDESRKWQMQWNPYRQCSWPPEDDIIESFRTRVVERARAALGADLARTEKFTTSMMDGLDIRETMRHWYDEGLYVKVQPPTIGHLDVCLLLFETQADPRDYPWRTTWYSEHPEESTLAFYATDYRREMIGPGIAVATYGGAMFIYPPRYIPNVWDDPRLDMANTMEERLIAAACLNSQSKHVAVLAPNPPNAEWRKLARRFHRKLVYVPLHQFNDATVQQLRTVHVLNGKNVRSYAAHFIRKA
jgi:hypothetical protein